MASLSSRSLVQRCLHVSLKPKTMKICSRALSSQFKPNKSNDDQEQEFSHPQEFVKMQFEPGEWDYNKTDPLHKPPFKSRAKILSAEDFAKRPRVGFEEEFDSYRDAMVTLTWMGGEDSDKVYHSYLQLMSKSGETTSHEYIMRVLAQRFNIDIMRVSAIVQMGHNEDQYRKEGRQILYDLQDYADKKVNEHIKNAYSEFNETEPTEFVEDPVGVGSMGDINQRCAGYTSVDDLVDVDTCVKEAIIRDRKNARLLIDGHIYIEDVDETKIDVKLSKETKSLMQTQFNFQNAEEAKREPDFNPMPGDNQERRSRWKYVAEIENSREIKKNKKKRISRAAKQKRIASNILVEQNGKLRAASVAEVKTTSLKPVRIPRDFAISGVRAAWLRRKLQGESDGWGSQQAPPEPEVDEVKDQEDTENEESADSAEGESVEIENPTTDEENKKANDDTKE